MSFLRSTSLHFILDQGDWNVEEIKQFLQTSSSTVNEVDYDHGTPLERVLESENCSIDVVKVLMDYAANVNSMTFNWETPLMIALSRHRNYAIIKSSIEKGADVKFRHQHGYTTLCHAFRGGASKDIVKLLLDEGCHPDACGHHYGRHVSVLHCASYMPNYDLAEGILELLFNAGGNLHIRGKSVSLALQAGAGAKDIEWLLRQGASLQKFPIHKYIRKCDRKNTHGVDWCMVLRADVIELYIKEGGEPTISISRRYTSSPLHTAVRDCRYEHEAIKLLMDFSGADVNICDGNNNNLLHSALGNYKCETRVLELLIERGTKVDGVNYCKQTPLHTAVKSTFPKLSVQRSIISILLKNNSPMNTVDRNGNTPLRYAVESECHPGIVRLLLSAGARVGIRDDGYILLKLVLNQYLKYERQITLDSLQLLVKYYFSENPDFKIDIMIDRQVPAILGQELLQLADECAREVKIMKSTTLDENRTLLDLINERSLPKSFAADKNPALSNNSLNNILRIMADNRISHFFADITATVGKSAMDVKLQELQVYCIQNCPVSFHAKEKVILIYDCVCEITPFLTRQDTMRLILAFCLPYNQIDRDNSIRNSMKRKAEDSENCDDC